MSITTQKLQESISRPSVCVAALLLGWGCVVLSAGCSTTGGPRLVWSKPEKKSTTDDQLASAKPDSSEKKPSGGVKIIDPAKLMAKVDGKSAASDEKVDQTAKSNQSHVASDQKIEPVNHQLAGAGEKSRPSTTLGDSPFQASRSQKIVTSAAPEMPPDRESSATSEVAKSSNSTSPAGSTSGSMSPATLRLIDQELAGANAEERAYWYDQLKKVDPAVVPQILQARRMSLQLTAQQADSGTPGNQPWSDSMATAQGSAPAWGHSIHSQKPMTANSGLGSASPWAQEESKNASIAGGRGNDDLNRSRRSAIQLAQHSDAGATQTTTGSGVTRAGHEVPAGTPERVQSAFYRVEQNPTDRSPRASGPIQPQSYQEPSPGQSSLPNASPVVMNEALGPAGKFGVVQSPVTKVSATGSSSANGAQAGFSSASGDSLDQLISQTESSVNLLTRGESPESRDYYLRQHVYLRLLYLMADRPERALAAIPGIPAAEQEFWQQMLWGLSNYFDSKQIPQSTDRASQAVAQFQSGVSKLKQMARLELRNVCFCKQIWYFGNYEKFPRDEFRPGQEVLVYAEAENFQSELTPEGQYRTLLRSKIDIISPAGEIRHQIEFPPTEDLCRNERRDYFHNYQFTIPEKMPLGPHSLKLTVHDELSGRVTSSSINFVVK